MWHVDAPGGRWVRPEYSGLSQPVWSLFDAPGGAGYPRGAAWPGDAESGIGWGSARGGVKILKKNDHPQRE